MAPLTVLARQSQRVFSAAAKAKAETHGDLVICLQAVPCTMHFYVTNAKGKISELRNALSGVLIFAQRDSGVGSGSTEQNSHEVCIITVNKFFV